MACRGVHFAITADQVSRLLAARTDDELVEIVVEEIEEPWDKDWLVATDKAWDALHRSLADGTLKVPVRAGTLGKCFFGGRVLNRGADYFVVLIPAEEVKEVAVALAAVTREFLRSRYFGLPFPGYQGTKDERDWGATWDCFQPLPDFFRKAAEAARHVIFTVDQ